MKYIKLHNNLRDSTQILIERVKNLEARQVKLEARDKAERLLIVKMCKIIEKMSRSKLIWT